MSFSPSGQANGHPRKRPRHVVTLLPLALAAPLLVVPAVDGHGGPAPHARAGLGAHHAPRTAGELPTSGMRLHPSRGGDVPRVSAAPETVKLVAGKRAKRRSVARAKRYARRHLSTRGWRALNRIAKRESGWRKHARNPSSGAYGIPQALPGRKMASAGRNWRHNATTQVKWMIRYVRSRYGGPVKAWRFWRRHHWY